MVGGQGTLYYTAAADRAPNANYGAPYYVAQVCGAGGTHTFSSAGDMVNLHGPNTGVARPLSPLPLGLLVGGLLTAVAVVLAGAAASRKEASGS